MKRWLAEFDQIMKRWLAEFDQNDCLRVRLVLPDEADMQWHNTELEALHALFMEEAKVFDACEDAAGKTKTSSRMLEITRVMQVLEENQ